MKSDTLADLRSAGRLVQRTLPDGQAIELVEKVVLVDAYDPESRSVEVIASDESVDRWGDVIEVNGWDLANFRRNPVILTDHVYSIMNIVGAGEPRIEKGQLRVRITLDAPESNRTAAIVGNLLKSGSLRAVSVGFLPKARKKILDAEGNWTGGFRFTSQELVEVSWVAVPANPNALLADAPKVDHPDEVAREAAGFVLAAGLAAIARRF